MSARIPIRAVTQFSSQGTRPGQEDCSLILQDKGVLVAADGFGGPEPGASASKAVCESVQRFLVKEAGDLEATLPFVLRQYFSLAGNVLFNALIFANRQLVKMNRGKGVHEKGGASAVAGFLDGDLLALANVGSCGAWLFREGRERELVLPRTYGKLVNPFGEDCPDELQVPLVALGIVNDFEPEIFEYRVMPGDWLILSTDGLTAGIRREILALQSRKMGPTQAAEAAAGILKQSKFNDNVSLLLAVF